MLMPTGSASSAKELMQLPKEMRDIALAANTLIRGNFSSELWPDLALLNAIAPRHMLTQIFIASVTAGSMAQNGQATTNTLQAMVNMIVPGALSPYVSQPLRKKEADKLRREHKNGKVPDDEE
jgi:hypothetical protein